MKPFFSAARLGVMAICVASWIAGPLSSAEPDLIELRAGRSLQLRAKADVYRTAIVDAAVCDIAQFTPRELSIVGKSMGQTQVTFWFDDPRLAPQTYLIDVQ
jgi:Flp pilus assembly secretin CpaC